MKKHLLIVTAVVALMFSGNIFAAGAQTDSANNTKATAAAQQNEPNPDKRDGAPAKFDGHVLYQRAFDGYYQFHVTLADKAAAAKFKAEWEHKFDKTGDLDTPEGTDRAIRLMRDSLGQRFDYVLSPEAFKDEQQHMQANYGGIGVPVDLVDSKSIIDSLPDKVTRNQFDQAMRISKGHELLAGEPASDAPAYGKIKGGDIITKIDGTPVDGMLMSDAVNKIRGAKGTTVVLTVERKNSQGNLVEINISIVRGDVPEHVVHSKDLGNGVTYIKLDDFEAQTAVKDMANAIHGALENSIKNVKNGGEIGGIVLDLRNNPGGDLNVFRAISQMFLDKGTMMIMRERVPGTDQIDEHKELLESDFQINEDRIGKQNPDIQAGDRIPALLPEDYPVVVLVNGMSASAAELLSGTLQANHRATIIGETTIGKGVGQTLIFLPYGRELHVTSFVFLPGGRESDWIGIIPDIQVAAATKGATSDPQVDAAIKELNKKNADLDGHEAQAQQEMQKHHKFFDEQIKKRFDEDSKPASQQDPGMQQ